MVRKRRLWVARRRSTFQKRSITCSWGTGAGQWGQLQMWEGLQHCRHQRPTVPRGFVDHDHHPGILGSGRGPRDITQVAGKRLRAWRCWGLGRDRHLLGLHVQVRISALTGCKHLIGLFPRTTGSNLARHSCWGTLKTNASGCYRPSKQWCCVPVCTHGHGDAMTSVVTHALGVGSRLEACFDAPPAPDAYRTVSRGGEERARAARRYGESQHHTRRSSRARAAQLEQLTLHAAGIDVGADAHGVAVPKERDAQPGQCFGACTADLYALAAWLRQCQMETVVMASTGVYGMALFAVLEARGFDVKLVDPHRGGSMACTPGAMVPSARRVNYGHGGCEHAKRV